MKKLIALCTGFCIVFSMLGAFTAFAEETAADLEIGTLAELEAFRDAVNEGNTYEGKTVRLTADIDMSEKYGEGKESWTAIGVNDWENDIYKRFLGDFDGDNHTISGLYAYTEEENGAVSFFSAIGGTVQNLNIKGSVIANNPSWRNSAAGIAGLVNENAQLLRCSFEGLVQNLDYVAGGLVESNMGLISNCRFKGKVEGQHLVGGIASTGEGTITDCINEGEVIGTTPVGGIAGWSQTIKNCINKGSVTGRTYVDTYTDYESGEPITDNIESWSVGGIVGTLYSANTIENCYNTGAVSGDSEVGGILGVADGSEEQVLQVKNCYSIGNITSTMEKQDGEHNIGAIIGNREYVSPFDEENATKTLTSEAVGCYYLAGTAEMGCGGTAEDTATALTAEQFAEQDNFANWDFGTVWEMNKTLKRPILQANREAYAPHEIDNLNDLIAFRDAVNSGYSYEGETVTLNADIDMSEKYGEGKLSWEPISDNNLIPFKGTFDGDFHKITGLYFNTGLSGLFMFNNGTIQNVSVSGDVVCESGGGIVGENYGRISRCSFSGSITGDFHLGGIAGANLAMDESTGIFDCYNTATVTSSDGVAGGIAGLTGRIERCYNIGSISANRLFASIGVGDGPIIDCYYLEGTSDKGWYIEYEEGTDTTTALTTEQFADKTNFTNWDFDTVWKMDEALDRPVLRTSAEEPPTRKHIHKICGDKNCTDNHEDIEWTAWDSANALPTEAGNYYLTTDVELAEEWETPDNTALCLNGHVIVSQESERFGIQIRGAKTAALTDCSDTAHKFAVGDDGRWTLDEENGTKMLTGGVIMAPKSDFALMANAAMDIYNINVVGSEGGMISSSRGLNLHGCTIAGNYKRDGILAYGKLSMRDCSIIENAGGVYIYKDDVSIGGKMVIADNGIGEKHDNLFLDRKAVIHIDEPLEEGSSIGVFTQRRAITGCPNAITGANDVDYSAYFSVDRADDYVTYSIQNGEGNVVYLAANAPTAFRVRDDYNGTRYAAAPTAGTYTAVLAVYAQDSGEMKKVMYEPVTFDEPSIKSIFDDVKITVDESYQVKLMLWDSLENMQPCCKPSSRYLEKFPQENSPSDEKK